MEILTYELAKRLSEYGYQSDEITKEEAETELFREFTEAEFEDLKEALFVYENYIVYGIE